MAIICFFLAVVLLDSHAQGGPVVPRQTAGLPIVLGSGGLDGYEEPDLLAERVLAIAALLNEVDSSVIDSEHPSLSVQLLSVWSRPLLSVVALVPEIVGARGEGREIALSGLKGGELCFWLLCEGGVVADGYSAAVRPVRGGDSLRVLVLREGRPVLVGTVGESERDMANARDLRWMRGWVDAKLAFDSSTVVDYEWGRVVCVLSSRTRCELWADQVNLEMAQLMDFFSVPNLDVDIILYASPSHRARLTRSSTDFALPSWRQAHLSKASAHELVHLVSIQSWGSGSSRAVEGLATWLSGVWSVPSDGEWIVRPRLGLLVGGFKYNMKHYHAAAALYEFLCGSRDVACVEDVYRMSDADMISMRKDEAFRKSFRHWVSSPFAPGTP